MNKLFSNSIKRRFILAYVLFIVFALTILLFNYVQYQKNIKNLNSLQQTFLPLNKQINTYSHYLHLHESFSLDTIINNYDRKNFLHSLTAINPKLFADKMQESFDNAESFLNQKNKNPSLHWLRIQKMFKLLQKKHEVYQSYIYKLANHIQIPQESDTEEMLKSLNQEHEKVRRELDSKKTEIINRINALSKIIHKQIETTITENISNENYLFTITSSVALLMILLSVLALQIGLQALRPFAQIKQASEKIKTGQYDLRLDTSGPIEFQSVAHSFNAMAQSLQERNEKIDQQHLQILHTQKLATIGEMATKINHEIRNPLNAIQLNLELLLDDDIPDNAKQNITSISSQIDRLFTITETYLQTAKKDTYKNQAIVIDDFLEDLQQFFRPSFASKHIKFVLNNNTKLKTLVFDESLLFQALLNVIRNALDACQNNDTIGLILEKNETHILFKLWNTGAMIDPDHQYKIFDAFYTSKKSGSGLGLSITKDLLSTQDADIFLESSTEEKTIFTIKIPYANKQ
ncbi:MAG TPA: HAMP domain-containing sensor histidine kinase [Oligoflexia bacterium]|nr:HAMP domain-containing sensor histidine kinase [Oligoflexia bacterium]